MRTSCIFALFWNGTWHCNKIDLDQLPWFPTFKLHRFFFSVKARGLGQDPSCYHDILGNAAYCWFPECGKNIVVGKGSKVTAMWEGLEPNFAPFSLNKSLFWDQQFTCFCVGILTHCSKAASIFGPLSIGRLVFSISIRSNAIISLKCVLIGTQSNCTDISIN